MNEKLIPYLKKYLISFAVMGLMTGFVLFIRDYSAKLDAMTRYYHLADAFTIPSVVMVMVGVMVWLASEGTFDMISYGLKRGLKTLIPFSKQEHETFYDYKKRKVENRIKGYSFLFISGGVYFIPAVIFFILYYCA